jgi:anti-sigma B factor antagonist
MSMEYHARQVGDVIILDVMGRLDVGTVLAFGAGQGIPLREVVRDFAARGQTKIVLNLRDVTYIDSSGIGELVAGVTTLRSKGGDLKVVNPNMVVQKLLRMTRIDPLVIEVKPDEASALQSFSKAAASNGATAS